MRGLLPILDADWLDRVGLVPAIGVGAMPLGRHPMVEAIARHLGQSAISWVQLRCKGDAERCLPFLSMWMEALRHHSPHLTIMINDHVELALALGADGVHVGQGDTSVEGCRRLLGPHKMVGLSTHSLAEVLAANQAAVDYIGFGPLFATGTKPDASAVQGLNRLAEVCRAADKPVVAIGGIQVAGLAEVAAAGATAVAMISGLWEKGGWKSRLEEAERGWTTACRLRVD